MPGPISGGGIATPISAPNGGTGIANNAASTLTISGNFGTTFTITGATSVTMPTSGTLATTTGSLVNNTIGSEVGLTAAGANQGAALVLSATVCYHQVSTAAASTGVRFGAVASAGGVPHTIRNDGANAIQVYGSASDTINGITTTTGISIPAGMACTFYQSAANAWTTTPGAGPLSLINGSAAVPALNFGTGNSGFFWGGSQSVMFSTNGTAYFSFQLAKIESVTGSGIFSAGFTATANTPLFSFNSDSDTGLGHPAANQVSLVAGGADQLIASTTTIIITSGVALKLGNAATTGLTAGVLAALTNASVVIQDSTGQAYRVPCII